MKTTDILNLPNYDKEIRAYFHKKKLKHAHDNPKVLVVDELGLLNGLNRVDIAVFNGVLHGYEIKGAKDNLLRMDVQLAAYKESLQKVTYIAAPNHIEELERLLPSWCGLIEATQGKRGAVHFKSLRPAKFNPEIKAEKLAHLLWKSEAQDLLQQAGYSAKATNHNRSELYKLIGSEFSVNSLFNHIKTKLMLRKNWRADLLLE
ncbi:sce7726 family protein [Vibrio vulnificus]|uniref:sce7726 family protein n=1 Tax=Vibrio TaxID=662 RepID=UPI000CD34A21|nr:MULTISPECIES: sce7726 family protein [Vibrio]AUV84820.1 hypothetical protein C1N50_00630 [Vibrio campbellii]EHH3081003.1 sce7726 family protein [Vibrio vulnificus]EIJ0971103.1 sce7726 family protein [Vibrio vulnificus]EIZ1007611.1 sce7726 family protein [Vibrio vulnificus]EIZ1173682.1 sce7726 family protein [Vibrio vulnificus]